MRAGGATHVLRVAVTYSEPTLVAQPKQMVLRVLSPKLRELWSRSVSSVSELSCERGTLVFAQATGSITFDISEDGEHLTLSSERAALQSALEAAWKSTPGSQVEKASSLVLRADALSRSAPGGMFGQAEGRELGELAAEARDLWTREMWWSHAGIWPHTPQAHTSGEFSKTPRGEQLEAEVRGLRAQKAPLFVEGEARIGTTPITDLSDVVWSGESPCVAQDAAHKLFRCYDMERGKWGRKAPRPADAVDGTIIANKEAPFRGRTVRIDWYLPHNCRLYEGTRKWQDFSDKEFCPERVSMSPSGRAGVGLVPLYTSEYEDCPQAGACYPKEERVGQQLWLFRNSAN